MKKSLFFAMLFFAASANAQFTDDIESYPVGPVHSGHWGSWASTDPLVDAYVSEFRSVSGTKSIKIGNNNQQDAVLDLGNKSTGMWSVSWKMYIPTDSAAYYNFQEVTPVTGGVFAVDFLFFYPGISVAGECAIYDDQQNSVATFNYPQSEWFTMDHIIDCDNDLIRVMVNGVEVYNGAYTGGGNLGGIDFYSISTNNTYFIDDVSFISGALTVENTDVAELSVYPNPMTDVVNITSADVITNVVIYDMLGKQIQNVNTNDTKVTLNTDELPMGTYLLKVTAGDKEEMMKIVK